jgi:hypothetical protein
MYGLSFEWGVVNMLASRFIVGFGSGTLGVNRTFAANIVAVEDRTAQFSWLGLTKFIGYAITPVVSAGLVFDWSSAAIRVDMHSGPGFFMAVVCFGLALVCFFFLSNAGGGKGSAAGRPAAELLCEDAPGAAPPTRASRLCERVRYLVSPWSWKPVFVVVFLFVAAAQECLSRGRGRRRNRGGTFEMLQAPLRALWPRVRPAPPHHFCFRQRRWSHYGLSGALAQQL